MFGNPFKGILKRYLILLLITIVAFSGFFFGLYKDEKNPISEKIKSEIAKSEKIN